MQGFLLLAANLLTSSRARMCCHAATPLSVFPAQRSISRGSVCSLQGWLGHWMQRCGQTPTCRMRFWCISGGGPPSGDVLLDEAILKSESEPPPLEWLSSGLLDILSRDACCCCCWRRRGQRGSFPSPRLISVWASECRRLGSARDHTAASETIRYQTWQNPKQRFWLQVVKPRRALSPFRDAPGMLPYVCLCACETWTRLICAFPKLRRINASFTDGRKLGKHRMTRTISVKSAQVAEMRSVGGKEQGPKWRRFYCNWTIITTVGVVILLMKQTLDLRQ